MILSILDGIVVEDQYGKKKVTPIPNISTAIPLSTSNLHSALSFSETRLKHGTFNEIHALDQAFSFREWGYLVTVSTGDYIKSGRFIFRVDIDRIERANAATFSSGSKIITISTTGIQVDQAITGAGIPKGAKVMKTPTSSPASATGTIEINLKTISSKSNSTVYFSTLNSPATATAGTGPEWNLNSLSGTNLTDGRITYTFFQDILNLKLAGEDGITQDPPQFYSESLDSESFRSYFGPWISDSTVFRAPFNNDGTLITGTPPGLDAGTFQSSVDYVLLLRSSLRDGIDNFETIAKFDATQFNSERYYYDYLVEPGMLYRYKLQGAKSDGTRGATTAATQQPQLIPDFTGSFLYGADDVQINFIYNGEVSGFKEIKKDSIIETIGGKYPFIVRNSNIGYKQFNFSAMITHVSDPTRSLSGLTYSELISDSKTKNNFIDERYEDYILYGSSIFTDETKSKYFTTSQNGLNIIGGTTYIDRSNNFIVEKEFRRKVMNWLYNGEPKVFKSDTEGLMLVKLTDVNFEPIKESGRILYSFSCTMTEIGPSDLDNLIKFGIKKTLYTSDDLYVVSNIENFTVEWTRDTYLPEGQYFYVYEKDNKRYRYYKVIQSGLSGSATPIGQNPGTNSETVVYYPEPEIAGNFKYIFIGYSIPGRF